MDHNMYFLVDINDRVRDFIDIYSNNPLFVKKHDCYDVRRSKLYSIKRESVLKNCGLKFDKELDLYALCEVVL